MRAHAGRRGVGRLVDYGAGVGVIGLAVAAHDASARVTAIELQPDLAALARHNFTANQLDARAEVHEADIADRRAMRRIVAGASQAWVVSNPPYRPLDEGSANPAGQLAIARHEVRLALPVLVAEMKRALVPGGRAALVYPAERLTRLLTTLASGGLTPTHLRPAYPRPGRAAALVLVLARKGVRSNLVVEEPMRVDEGDAAD